MSRHNAAAKRRPTGWRRWYAHCSWCDWLDVSANDKADAERRAQAHNDEMRDAA